MAGYVYLRSLKTQFVIAATNRR